jgi:hypothetical protein
VKEDTETSPFALLAGDDGFDPLEDGVRQRVRRFIEAIIEEELRVALAAVATNAPMQARPVIATAIVRGRSSARSAPRR